MRERNLGERNPAIGAGWPGDHRPRAAPALLPRLLVALLLTGFGSWAQAQTCPGLVVTPATTTVVLPQSGQAATLPVTATYSGVNAASGLCNPATDVTANTLWTSSNPAVAAFASPNSPNLLTPLTTGTTSITGSFTPVGNNVPVLAFSQVTVSPPPLAGLPGITPNQRSVGQALDGVCQTLNTTYNSDFPAPPPAASLIGHCTGIQGDPNPQNRAAALAAISGQDFTSFQSQALVFSQAHTANVLDRMMALRAGARGLSVADVTLNTANGPVSLAELAGFARDVLGGGASADADGGGLLSDRLGIWLRGNYGSGSKDASIADNGFDGHQVTATLGADYRVGSQSVLGVAVGIARAGIGFRSVGGGLDTHGVNASLYGSSYLYKNLYLDALANYGHSSYATTRHIVFVESGSTVDETALGSTGGRTLNGSLYFGYDFGAGGLTVTPMVGYAYSRATVNAFTESGASGLDLSVDEQTIKSATVNVGLQMNFAWNTSFGVILPHLRVTSVHELEEATPMLGMHFAADPLGSAGSTFAVQGDVPNRVYWKLAAGTSIQFKHGIAGYVEYQRLENYGAAKYGDVTLGLRAQTRF
jgi:outer membrane autotransporter protein